MKESDQEPVSSTEEVLSSDADNFEHLIDLKKSNFNCASETLGTREKLTQFAF